LTALNKNKFYANNFLIFFEKNLGEILFRGAMENVWIPERNLNNFVDIQKCISNELVFTKNMLVIK
jgi:hypothetical protein